MHRRASREEARRFLVEGPQGVREALVAPAAPGVPGAPDLELFCTADGADRHADLVTAATAAGAAVHLVSADAMAALATTVHPQGIAAVCPYVDVPLATALAGARLVAVLTHVRDPGNAGTVLRAADAAGADAVVLTEASVDVHNPKTVRSSAGSLFHLPVVTGVAVEAAVAAARAGGLRVVAADVSADRTTDEADDAGELAAPTAWLFGNEAWGLPADVLAAADTALKVPIHGRAESLNLAVSAALCLYASARAHRRTR